MRPWPDLSRSDLRYCADAVATSGALTCGPLTERLERMVASSLGSDHAVAVNSGTSALEAVLTAVGVRRGTEVIVPEYGFPAAAIACLRLGAKVRLARVLWDLSVDPTGVEELITRHTRAVVGIDVGGYPALWAELETVCRDAMVWLIEDAAAAWASTYSGRRCGTFGHAGVLSLSQSKMVGAGEGGIIVTEDETLARRLRALRRYGELPGEVSSRRRMTWAGANWKITEMTASIALLQLRRLSGRAARSAGNRELLDAALAECNYLSAVAVEPEDFVAPHKYRVFATGGGGGVVLTDMAAQRMPVLRDDVQVLYDHPPFSAHPLPLGSLGSHVLERSFILGERAYPLWHVEPTTVQGWCDQLLALDKEADRWLK